MCCADNLRSSHSQRHVRGLSLLTARAMGPPAARTRFLPPPAAPGPWARSPRLRGASLVAGIPREPTAASRTHRGAHTPECQSRGGAVLPSPCANHKLAHHTHSELHAVKPRVCEAHRERKHAACTCTEGQARLGPSAGWPQSVPATQRSLGPPPAGHTTARPLAALHKEDDVTVATTSSSFHSR